MASNFSSALQSWSKTFPDVSVRQLSISSGLNNGLISLWRAGTREITLEALTKLLPAIEAASTRQHAVTLLIAYLSDETPPGYAQDIRIEAIDTATGTATPDTYAALAHEWEDLARTDPKFHAVWSGLNDYIQHPERLTADAPPEPAKPPYLYPLHNPGSTSRAAEEALADEQAILDMQAAMAAEAERIRQAGEQPPSSEPGTDTSRTA